MKALQSGDEKVTYTQAGTKLKLYTQKRAFRSHQEHGFSPPGTGVFGVLAIASSF